LSNPIEVWRPVPGLGGYEASDQGRVRSYWGRGARTIGDKPQLLRLQYDHHYHVIRPRKGAGKERTFKVGHLVLLAFVGPCPPGMQCRHLNDIGTDNRLANVVWGTRSENQIDRSRNGRNKLKPDQVREIRRLRAEGLTHKAVAARIGVSRWAVREVLRGKTWAHLA
jgi:hypothetical protein